jgi:uroporphyrin-III C-methyltransferase
MNTIFAYHKEPKLTLVGAGPGDPELITLKAIKKIQQADIVLYDALVAQPILDFIPVGTPALAVGKRAGLHSYKQEDINELIVEFAYLYGHVVRLKGGDPFVFGRGGEEMEFAARHGVATEVVPGISSAVAVPAALNIPVTSRGYSESFWVVTGTTRSGEMSNDITLAAKSTATVVILMGLSKLKEIMEVFQLNGKSETPVAIIQNGTLTDQKHAIGTATTIEDLVQKNRIGSPAIIVVGEVVRYADVIRNLSANAVQVTQFQ